ncbi:MAG: 4Fe-4S binding protein [Candidatus Bathyarchaeota archaeon]|nr:MAG: 4Fe-4S binding protein [Candidatus Bathyarchaeota archaeon]
MIIDAETCTGCRRCIPYCTVGAIKLNGKSVFIDQDTCVECGVCLRSEVCQVDSIGQPELSWPRVLRAQFSDPAVRHPTGVAGRGTEEMKTNDVTGRFKEGEVGFGFEFGRPGVGTTFADVEKATRALAEHVEFSKDNPVTLLIDPKTGRLQDNRVRRERVLSAIIECKTSEEKAVEVIRIIQTIAGKIDTVFSVDAINRCVDGTIPVKKHLDKAGIHVRVNGKTCIGLGRPLADI